MTESIVSRIYYGYSVFLPILCFAMRFEKRSHFLLRLILCAGFGLIYNVVIGVLHEALLIEMHSAHGINTIILFFLGNVFLAALTCWICYRMTIWSAFYCSTAGYCLQHIWERTVDLTVSRLLGISKSVGLSLLLALLLTAGCIVLYRFVIIRMTPPARDHEQRWGQLLLSLLVIASIVLYYQFILVDVSQFVNKHGTEADAVKMIGNTKRFISMLVNLLCVFCLYGELSIYRTGSAQAEAAVLEHLIEEQRERYESERGNIELLNIRLHDLKHRYGTNDPKTEEEIARLTETFNAAFHTGNEAIDTVLYVRSTYCLSHEIRLRCIIDGKRFNSFPAQELYSLFGNALENAIEAVEPLKAEDRWICISQQQEKGFFCLRFENACPEPVAIRDGMPVGTGKGEGHGYGMKSIRVITERHGGHVNAFWENGIFTLDMFFVLKEDGQL